MGKGKDKQKSSKAVFVVVGVLLLCLGVALCYEAGFASGGIFSTPQQLAVAGGGLSISIPTAMTVDSTGSQCGISYTITNTVNTDHYFDITPYVNGVAQTTLPTDQDVGSYYLIFSSDGQQTVYLQVVDIYDQSVTGVSNDMIATVGNPQSTYTLTASVSVPNAGTISLSPSGGVYSTGTVVTATFTLSQGTEWQFDYWTANGVDIGAITSIQVNMQVDTTLVAVVSAVGSTPSPTNQPTPTPTPTPTGNPTSPTPTPTASSNPFSTPSPYSPYVAVTPTPALISSVVLVNLVIFAIGAILAFSGCATLIYVGKPQ